MLSTKKFIPGLDLNRKFYHEEVRPLIHSRFPDLPHAAALIGYGSDVLGFDTAISMDHNWGPRLQIFLEDPVLDKFKQDLQDHFSWHLPGTFRGFSVNFTDQRTDHTQSMQPKRNPPWIHLIEISSVPRYFQYYLNPRPEDRNRLTDQRLLELTAGEVFHDDIGELTAARKALAFHPRDIWLIRLAALWDCIRNEEAFVGRARDLEDFPGAKLLACRMTGWLMKICFYLEKRYIPYSKWLGPAWKTLKLRQEMQPLIDGILTENNPSALAAKIAEATHRVLEIQNRLGDIPQIQLKPVNYYNRPYKTLMAGKIVSALREAVADDQLRKADLNIIALDLKLDSCVLK